MNRKTLEGEKNTATENMLLFQLSEVIAFSLGRSDNLIQDHVKHFVQSCKGRHGFPFSSRNKSRERGCE